MDKSLIYIIICLKCVVCIYGECTYPRDKSKHDAISRIEPLVGKQYSVDDNGDPALLDSYVYNIGICATARDYDPDKGPIGAVQISKKTQETKELGRYDSADIKGGSNWVMLEYSEGDKYNSHCSQGKRKTVIMIICSEKETKGVARLIEENNNKSADCYYLFEIDHSAVCPKSKDHSGLGTGSIIFIVVLIALVLYFTIGFGYQRYVVGAKGIEQIPNFSFWRYCGNLQADGCNYICRCGFLPEESKPYRPVADDNIEEEDDNRVDDNLLPM